MRKILSLLWRLKKERHTCPPKIGRRGGTEAQRHRVAKPNSLQPSAFSLPFSKSFTLIGILIAVTLLIVVAVAAFSTFRGGTAAWQKGTAHAQRDAEAPFASGTAPHWRTVAGGINTWDSREAGEVTPEDPATTGTLPDAIRITLTSHPEGLAAKDFSIVTELPRAEPEPFGFTISLSPFSGTVVQGGQVTPTVDVELTGGITETVNLSVIVPTGIVGITGTLSTSSGLPGFTSNLTLTAASNATLGTHTIEVRSANAAGDIIERAFYALTVYSAFNFSLSVSPTVVSTGRSDVTITAIVDATLTPGTEPRGITFDPIDSISGVPAHTTATISPTSGTPTFSALLEIVVTTDTPLGDHTITISATGSDITRTTTLILSVFDFSLSVNNISSGPGGSPTTTVTATLTPGSGSVGEIFTEIASALPPGVISITGHGSLPVPGILNLTVTTSPTISLGNHPTITISASTVCGVTRSDDFTLSVFNITLSVSPDINSLRGVIGSTTVTATLTPGSGTPAVVETSTFSVVPGGAGIVIGNHGPITPTLAGSTRTLDVITTTATPLDNHIIIIRATCHGGVTWDNSFTLSLFDFTLSVSPNVEVTPGGSGSTTVTATLTPGSSTPTSVVTSTVSVVPGGVGIGIGPHGTITPTLAGSTWPLNVTTTGLTPPDNHTITIRATGGGGFREATFTLRVVDFSLSVHPAIGIVAQGESISGITVTVHGTLPTAGVHLTASVPDGTATFIPSQVIPPASTSTLTIATTGATSEGTHSITITTTCGNATLPLPIYTLTVIRPVDFQVKVTRLWAGNSIENEDGWLWRQEDLRWNVWARDNVGRWGGVRHHKKRELDVPVAWNVDDFTILQRSNTIATHITIRLEGWEADAWPDGDDFHYRPRNIGTINFREGTTGDWQWHNHGWFYLPAGNSNFWGVEISIRWQ